MSIKQTTLWSDDEFQNAGYAFIGIGKKAWEAVTEMAFQCILHYHVHSYSPDRIKQVMSWLIEANMGQMESAFRVLLKATTGVSLGKLKHNSKALEEVADTWENVLQQCKNLGLASFTPEKAGPKGAESGVKKDANIKIDGRVSEELVNALKVFTDEAAALDLDGDTAGALAMLKGAGAVASSLTFQNEALAERYQTIGQKLQQLEAQEGKTEATSQFKAETGIGKAFRVCDALIKGADRGLGDLFQAVLEAKKAA